MVTEANRPIAGTYGDLALYQRLLRQARPYGKQIVVLLLLDLLASQLVLLTPLPLKIAIDHVVGARPLPEPLAQHLPTAFANATFLLILAAGLVVAVALLNQLFGLASLLLRNYTGERLVLAFRSQLFGHVQRLSLAYHDAEGTADSAYRIQYDAAALQYILIDGVIPFVTSVLSVGLMLMITLRLDWQLGLVALGVAPVLLLLSGVYRQRLRQRSREVKKLESSALAVVQEVLTSLRVVKAFVQEQREHDRFLEHSFHGVQARLRLLVAEGFYGLVVGTTTALGTAAVLFIGIGHVQAGLLTLGDLLLVMGYLAQLYEPLKTISRKVATLQSHLAGAERAFALLDRKPDVEERPQARPLGRAAGAVRFDRVTFGYEKGRPILHDLSFALEPGARLGIVGATGAGKTTLVSLLTRFYDPSAGRILLDGVDLRDYRLTDLRNQFAMVLQDTVLFSTSIAENIAYARPGASDAEIIAAAKAAHAHEFIARLPDGYATRVGERGMRLSGGERQRIALARAFLKDAAILILDEPTSAVDVRTEAAILEAMEQLMQGRTSVLITHRFTTLAACDCKLTLDRGRLVGPTAEAGILTS